MRVGVFGVALLAVLAATYLWLSEHSVHTRFGTQFILDRFNSQLAGHQVVAVAAELHWHPVPRTVELELERVQFQNAQGETFVVADAASIHSPLRRLVAGDFSPGQVTIETPRLHVVRTESGARILREIDGDGRMPAAALLAVFTGGGGSGVRTTVRSSEIRFSDDGTGSEWHWAMGTVRYESRENGGVTEVSVGITDPLGRMYPAQASASWDDAGEVVAEYQSVPLGLVIAELSGRSQLADQLPLIATGELQASVSNGWTQPEITGAFVTEPVMVSIPAWGEAELNEAAVEFTYLGERRTLNVTDFRVAVDHQPVTGTAQINLTDAAQVEWVRGRLAASALSLPAGLLGVVLADGDVTFELPATHDRIELTSITLSAADRVVDAQATVHLDPSWQVTEIDGRADVQLTSAGWEIPGATVWGISATGTYSADRRSVSVTEGRVVIDALNDGTRDTLELAGTMQVDLNSDGTVTAVDGSVSISPIALGAGALGEVQLSQADLHVAYSGESGTTRISDVQVQSTLGSFNGGLEFTHDPQQQDAATPVTGRLQVDQLILAEQSPWGQVLRISDYAPAMSYHAESAVLELAAANARIGPLAATIDVRLANLARSDAALDLRIELPDATPNGVRELWPPWIAAAGRAWFFENTPAGIIDAQVFVTGLLADPQPTIEMNFRDLDIRYLPTMPPIAAAAGSGRITLDEFSAQLHEGEVPIGDGVLDVRGSAVEFTGVNEPVPWARVRLAAAGDAARLVRLLEFEPIQLSQRSGFHLRPAGGQVTVAANLEFPLLQRLDVSEVEHDISVQLEDIALTSGWSNMDVHGGSGTLSVHDGELTMVGEFRAGTADVKLDLRTESDPELPAGTTQYVMDGRMSLAAPIHRGAATVGGGVATFAARIRTRPDQRIEYALEADLAELAVDLGTTDAKRRGEPGQFHAAGDFFADGMGTAEVRFELPGLQAGGPIEISAAGISLDLTGTLAADHLGGAAQYLEPGAVVAGTFRLKPVAEGHTAVAMSLDFTPNRVVIPETGIVKVPGRPGGLRVGGEMHGQGMQLHTVAFELDPVRAEGEMRFDDDGEFRSASFGEVRIGERSRLAVQVRREPGTATHVTLFGDILDLQEIRDLHEPEDAIATPVVESEPQATGATLEEPIVVDAQLRRLLFAQDIWLEDVAGRVTARSSSDLNGALSGLAFGELDASLEFRSMDGELEQVLKIDNAGEVLDALGYTSTISGGRIRISRGFTAADADANRRLVELLDVDVHNAPVFAQLLSFVSGVGLVEYIVAGNTAFSTIRMVVEEDGDLLRFTDGVAESASMGFIFVGDLNRTTGALEVHGYATPVRFLTRILGEIPILGFLVEGDEGESTLGVGFVVTGTVDDPETNVQALSLLVPFLPRLQNLETSSGTGAEASQDESATEQNPPAN